MSSTTESAARDGDASARPRLVGPFTRFLLRLFFRRVEVVGEEHVPETGPIVYVANHGNALVDPALLMGFLERKPRFLAKSTLWKNPVVRPFLALAAAIPVYRKQDGSDTSRNRETFARCHEVLAAGGAIGLFPEGRSHHEPALVPLKTGVSRIILGAEARFGGLGTRIVPVGLTFDEKARFRSRALVAVGPPVAVGAELTARGEEDAGAIGALQARIEDALEGVTLNYPSWREARLLDRAAELYARPGQELPAEVHLEERLAVGRAVVDGYRRFREEDPERVAAIAAEVEEYDDLLEVWGLDDRQVASSYPSRGVLGYVGRSLRLLLLTLPVAALGTVLNVLAFYAVRAIAGRFGTTPDVRATYKLLGSLLVYPLAWTSEALAVASLTGEPAAGLVVGTLGPATGWVALRFHERRRHFGREARAYLRLRRGHDEVTELRALRRRILADLESLRARLA